MNAVWFCIAVFAAVGLLIAIRDGLAAYRRAVGGEQGEDR